MASGLNFFRRIDKRKRAVAATFVVSIMALFLTFFPLVKIIFWLPIFVGVIYLVSYFALLEDLKHIEYFVLFIFPIYFSVSFILFYYLLPSRFLTRVPFLIIFTIGFYAILLSENIFNIGVDKSLPLYRAAYSVSNFITTIVLFFIFTVLFSLRQHFLINVLLGTIITWPIFFHSVWTASPKDVLEERVYKFATILSLLFGCVVFVLNFIPVRPNVVAIYTSSIAYVLLSITQEVISDTVYRERIQAYVIIFLLISLLVFLSFS